MYLVVPIHRGGATQKVDGGCGNLRDADSLGWVRAVRVDVENVVPLYRRIVPGNNHMSIIEIPSLAQGLMINFSSCLPSLSPSTSYSHSSAMSYQKS